MEEARWVKTPGGVQHAAGKGQRQDGMQEGML